MTMARIIPYFLLVVFTMGWTTDKDIAIYEPTKTFYGKPDTILTLDFSDKRYPKSIDPYNPVAHTEPIRQDTTGTCWCFAATSLLESELLRLGYDKTKLSRMYTVYWEYFDKARRFVREKGNSAFEQGAQLNSVILRLKKYGVVRESDYSGLLNKQTIHNHKKMYDELNTYLGFIKKNNQWNENQVLVNVQMILNRYLGKPPETIRVDGKELTPKDYLQSLPIDPDDYLVFLSLKKFPFWTLQEYPVPDNWWHCPHYYNIPLPEFYAAIKSSIKKGFSVAIAGDVSEPGKYGNKDIAIIPTFDIPSEYIDQESREFRFYNKTTTDDHGVHLIGYKEHNGDDWYLIKDSASSAYKGRFPGYHFFHGDYIRLKILTFMVHKDAVTDLIKKVRTTLTDVQYDSLFDLGAQFFNKGYYDKAIAHYLEMSRLRPDDVSAYNNYGYLLLQQNRLDEAIQAFDKSISLDPNYAYAHNNMGDAILKKWPNNKDKINMAIKHFKKALEIKSDLELAEKNLDKARKMLNLQE